MNERLKSLSKTISYALRHNPGEFGLVPDEEGWVYLLDLYDSLKKRFRYSDVYDFVDDLDEIEETSDKQRFQRDGGQIRAFYGHSTVEVKREPAQPPDTLYHGTTRQAMSAIALTGLKPMSRQNVHFTTDVKTAKMVAGRRRHSESVILEIDAKRAYEDGINFYAGNEDIWLGDALPAKYIIGEV